MGKRDIISILNRFDDALSKDIEVVTTDSISMWN